MMLLSPVCETMPWKHRNSLCLGRKFTNSVILTNRKASSLQSVNIVTSIDAYMINLVEKAKALLRVSHSWVFKRGRPVKLDRHKQNCPASWLEDTVQLVHRFAIIWHMFQYMRTQDHIKGGIGKGNVGDIHL